MNHDKKGEGLVATSKKSASVVDIMVQCKITLVRQSVDSLLFRNYRGRYIAGSIGKCKEITGVYKA